MRRVLLLALALAGGAVAGGHTGMDHGGYSGHITPPDAPVRSMTHLKALKGRAFDVAWTGAMIVHHDMAIQMAKSELNAGRDARVRAAARGVISAQRREIDLMNAWRRTWGAGVIPGGAASMVGPKRGESWDHWFLTGMIPHHEGAVAMARLVPARTQTAEVRKLAAQIVADQTREIGEYRAWLKVVR